MKYEFQPDSPNGFSYRVPATPNVNAASSTPVDAPVRFDMTAPVSADATDAQLSDCFYSRFATCGSIAAAAVAVARELAAAQKGHAA